MVYEISDQLKTLVLFRNFVAQDEMRCDFVRKKDQIKQVAFQSDIIIYIIYIFQKVIHSQHQ